MKKKTTTIRAVYFCLRSTEFAFLFLLVLLLIQANSALASGSESSRRDYATQTPYTGVPQGTHTGNELGAIAWRFYNNGKYEEAEKFFRASLDSGLKKDRASTLLGLGYTCLKLRKFKEAKESFRKALEHATETEIKEKAQEGLFLAAMSSGDAAYAWTLLNRGKQDGWKGRYRTPDIEIPLCIKAGDTEGAVRLYQKYHSNLAATDDSKEKGLFLSLLRFLADHNVSSYSICNDLIDHRFPPSPINACLNGLKQKDKKGWTRLSRRIRPVRRVTHKTIKTPRPSPSKAMLASEAFKKEEYERALELSTEALSSQPEEIGLISLAAWSAFHTEQWEKAEVFFRKGLEADRNNQDLLSGLCWSLIRQGKCEECVSLIDGRAGAASKGKLSRPLAEALKCAGIHAYRDEKWNEASAWFERYMTLSGHEPGIEEMLAWSYYHSGRWDKADRAFARLLEERQESSWIKARARALTMQGKKDQLAGLYEKYYGSPCRHGDLAAYLYAAGADQRTVCRSAGCEDYLAAGIDYRNRSGDNGQGRLDDWSLPALYARYRLRDDLLFRATGALRHVSNKRHSDDFADAYFSFLYDLSPALHLSAGAGFTGSGALIGTRPLWHSGAMLDTSNAGEFAFTAYRSTVDDSLLSIAGSRSGHKNGIVCTKPDCRCEDCQWDQNGACDKFGGVMRTGAYISWKGDVGRMNLSALLDFEELTGTKVRRNHKYLANLSGGTSIPVPRRFQTLLQPLWAGMYATWFRYERNLNYYTCGNGGYFSPRSFIGAGPVLNIRTIEGRCWIASLDASAGYVNYIEDDGWQFPRKNGTERGCRYDGRSLNLIGFGFHGRSAWRLNKYLALEARGGVDRSADFTEWGAALNLIVYPSRVAGLFFSGLPEGVPWLP